MGEWKTYYLEPNLISFQAYNNTFEMRSCPEELRPFLVSESPLAYTSYNGSAKKKGNIAHYLLKISPHQLKLLAKEKGHRLIYRNIFNNSHNGDLFSAGIKFEDESIDKNYDISYIFSKDLKKEILKKILRIDRHDISDFCKQNTSKNLEEKTRITFVDEIISQMEFKYVKPKSNELVVSGKSDFYDICKLQIGLDLSRGCIANIFNETFAPSKRCEYCYAKWRNGPPALTSQFEFTEEELEERIERKIKTLNLSEKEPIVFRFGQGVEVNIPKYLQILEGYEDNLKKALKVLQKMTFKRDIKTTLVSKIIEYDKERAEDFKSLDLSLVASVGIDSLEEGIVAHGFPTQKRLDELLKYAKDGVNSNIFVAVDVTRGFDCLHDDAKKAFNFFLKHQDYLGLQFLDFRITRKNLCKIISGEESMAKLTYKNPVDSLPGVELIEEGKWAKTSNSAYAAHRTHPDFLSIKSEGRIRLCSTHVIKEEQACGGCFMFGKKKTTKNDEEIIKKISEKN